jgi:hypothetical protein
MVGKLRVNPVVNCKYKPVLLGDADVSVLYDTLNEFDADLSTPIEYVGVPADVATNLIYGSFKVLPVSLIIRFGFVLFFFRSKVVPSKLKVLPVTVKLPLIVVVVAVNVFRLVLPVTVKLPLIVNPVTVLNKTVYVPPVLFLCVKVLLE